MHHWRPWNWTFAITCSLRDRSSVMIEENLAFIPKALLSGQWNQMDRPHLRSKYTHQLPSSLCKWALCNRGWKRKLLGSSYFSVILIAHRRRKQNKSGGASWSDQLFSLIHHYNSLMYTTAKNYFSSRCFSTFFVKIIDRSCVCSNSAATKGLNSHMYSAQNKPPITSGPLNTCRTACVPRVH